MVAFVVLADLAAAVVLAEAGLPGAAPAAVESLVAAEFDARETG